ncbi:hypothetical protein A2U01_0084271, partial [Trifolium medium]|nr:hypothetical protein [Trifolium medium]
VYGRQGITVENRSGPRRSSSKDALEAQTRMEDFWKLMLELQSLTPQE